MATIFTHPVVALAAMPWFRDVKNSRTTLFVGMLLTILPDLDVIGFRLGIPYDHFWGHRGFTHSLFFAVCLGALVALLMSRSLTIKTILLWLYFSLCTASHGFLDAFTNGGLGVAFFSPFAEARHFFSVNPIEVSTLSITRFFQGQGQAVLKSELLWIWLPCLAVMMSGLLLMKVIKRYRSGRPEQL